MINPDLNLHSRSNGGPVSAATPLSEAAEIRLPTQLAHGER
jgi:hypothetical protein